MTDLETVNSSSERSPSELMEALLDKVPAMLAYWDSSQRCRFANAAYRLWFGVSPQELIGRHISELLGIQLYALNRPYIEGVLHGVPQRFEREIPDPTGGPSRQALANYVPDIIDGQVRGFFVLVTDVSELKRAQTGLREWEDRFGLTLQEAPIGMALVGLDGRFIRVNRSLCEIVGYTADELTGLTFQAITHPDDLDTELALAARLMRGEIPRYQLEKRYVRKDGTLVDILFSGSVVRDPVGRPIHFIAQVEDISGRRRMERQERFLAEAGAVLTSTLEYEETLARVAELVVRELADLCMVEIVEDDGEIRRLKVVSRDPGKRALCEGLLRVHLDRDLPYLLRSVLNERRTVLLERPTSDQIAAHAQNEEHLSLLRQADIRSFLGVPLIARGRLVGGVALVSSTPSHLFGPADVRLAEQLAQRAAFAIDNARLYRLAQRATLARDDLLGIVAHDLRNPLSTVLANVTTLQRRCHDIEKARKPVLAIERGALRMNRLIEDLLDVTRIEAGTFPVQRARLSPREVIAECVEGQQALAAAASVSLVSDIPEGLPVVWADRDRLHQVCENLVGNALKFTPSGGTVRIGAAARNGEILFWVSDTGQGIERDQVSHAFDRFWQARHSQHAGTGLGLAITKGIVEAHQGLIWIESTPGRGTTVFFTIPVAPHLEAFEGEVSV